MSLEQNKDSGSIFAKFIIWMIVVAIVVPMSLAAYGIVVYSRHLKSDDIERQSSSTKSVDRFLTETIDDLQNAANSAVALSNAQRSSLAPKDQASIVASVLKKNYHVEIFLQIDERDQVVNGYTPPGIRKDLMPKTDFASKSRTIAYWQDTKLIYGIMQPVDGNDRSRGRLFLARILDSSSLSTIAISARSDIIITEGPKMLSTSNKVATERLHSSYREKFWSKARFEAQQDGVKVTAVKVPFAFDQAPPGLSIWAVSNNVASMTSDAMYLFGLVFMLILAVALVIVGAYAITMKEQLFMPLQQLARAVADVVDRSANPKLPQMSKHAELRALQRNITRLIQQLTALREGWSRRSRELNVLHEMSQVAARATDIWELANIIAENALHLAKTGFAHLVLINQETQELELQVFKSKDPSLTIDVQAILENGLLEQVIEKRMPIVFNNKSIQAESNFSGQIVASAICVPLGYGEKVEGILIAGTTDPKIHYTPDEIQLIEALANGGAVAVENARVYEYLQTTYLNTVKALATAIDAKDPFTHGHSERVARLVNAIAKKRGWAGQRLKGLETAAYLHDIGKLGISNDILLKEDELTSDEYSIIKRHPVIGTNILCQVDFPWDILPIIKHHHERFDGGGYPGGLAGSDIPEGSRILSVADVFESLTAERPYRTAMSFEEAMAEIERNSGSQFDPEILEAFKEVVGPSFVKKQVITELEETGDIDQPLSLRAAYSVLAQGLLEQFVKTAGLMDIERIDSMLNDYFAANGWSIRVEGTSFMFGMFDDIDSERQADFYRQALDFQINLMEKTLGRHSVAYFCYSTIESASAKIKEIIRKNAFDKICEVETEAPALVKI